MKGMKSCAGEQGFRVGQPAGSWGSGRMVMAKRHKSAMKRMRQDEQRHLRNVSVKSSLKTFTKRVESLVAK
jgi:hypothetical protein